VRVEENQTHAGPDAAGGQAVRAVPQLSLSGWTPEDRRLRRRLMMDATRFSHPTLVTGSRFLVNPSLAYPVRGPGSTSSSRGCSGSAPGTNSTARGCRTAAEPHAAIASIDGGLVFEREANWFGSASVADPRAALFYAYVPYRDQSDLPVFDTAEADFNFTQLFRENRFSGFDRVSEANQLTAALVGRILDPATGTERLQRRHRPALLLLAAAGHASGGTASTGSESDLLLELRGVIARGWITDFYCSTRRWRTEWCGRQRRCAGSRRPAR